MIPISTPASQRTCRVWTGFRKIQLWCTAVQWNKHKIRKIYGCVTFLRLCFPSKNSFWSGISAELLSKHQVLLLWPSWQSADGEVEQNVWRATQFMVLGGSHHIMCLLGHGSCVNGFQIFQCKFASRFLQTPKHWKIFSRKFHYQGALISQKFCKRRENERRYRKMLKILWSINRALWNVLLSGTRYKFGD